MAFRSLLFVPGARPDRFESALSSGADAVIIDLEDAVLPEEKETARQHVLDWLGANTWQGTLGVRLNSIRSATGCADIAGLAAAAKPDFVVMPKAETAADIAIAKEALDDLSMLALIETPGGLASAHEIASVADAGLLFGGVDYSTALGADIKNWDAMLYARSAICAAAAAGGVAAYDVPYLDVDDTAGHDAETTRSKALGFAGKACIHPSQVASVNTIFTPDPAEIERAQAILNAFEAANGGVALYKGKMIDWPVLLAARKVLKKAGREG